MKKFFSFIFFLLILFLTFNITVFAEKIESYDVDVVAQKDGSMMITEFINYDFESQDRHGIFRYIPLYTKVGDLYRVININNVKVHRNGKNEKFKKSQNDNQIYLKIGDPDKTINGAHVYEISYIVENGVGSNFPDYDEIYWNATGNGWEVPIKNSSISISNDFGVGVENFFCFTGVFSSGESDCSVSNNKANTERVLIAGEGLTAVAVFPKGTFPPSVLSKSPPQTFVKNIFNFIYNNALIIWVFLNLFLTGIIFIWYQRKKNKKRFGKPSVNFDIPKDESGERIMPALAGIIDSAKLERDDVVATIFDLAIRKYIKLESIKKEKRLGFDENLQKIKKLKDEGGLNSFEKELFNSLFIEGKDHVFIKDLKKDFYKTFDYLEKDAFKILVRKKYFVKNPKGQKTLLLILAFFAMFTVNFILAGVLFYLSRKLIGRTELGDEIDFQIDGLKLFLKSMNRNYNWQAEKLYTVEQMIPYAVSLGYIEEFMKQLKIIKPDYNPTWYGGYRGSFFLAYTGLNSSMNRSITTANPSSSGAGGGGFSGGGGGGGGGGSW